MMTAPTLEEKMKEIEHFFVLSSEAINLTLSRWSLVSSHS